MKLIIAAMFLLITYPVIAAATFHWPWESRHRVHYRQHKGHRVAPPFIVPPDSLPDCRQINEAVKALDPDHLERALRHSNRFQRDEITKCQTQR